MALLFGKARCGPCTDSPGGVPACCCCAAVPSQYRCRARIASICTGADYSMAAMEGGPLPATHLSCPSPTTDRTRWQSVNDPDIACSARHALVHLPGSAARRPLTAGASHKAHEPVIWAS